MTRVLLLHEMHCTVQWYLLTGGLAWYVQRIARESRSYGSILPEMLLIRPILKAFPLHYRIFLYTVRHEYSPARGVNIWSARTVRCRKKKWKSTNARWLLNGFIDCAVTLAIPRFLFPWLSYLNEIEHRVRTFCCIRRGGGYGAWRRTQMGFKIDRGGWIFGGGVNDRGPCIVRWKCTSRNPRWTKFSEPSTIDPFHKL